jgi:hypothetical protein
MTHKEIEDALNTRLKDAVLKIDISMRLFNVVREINLDRQHFLACNASGGIVCLRVNKTSIWADVKKFRKQNHCRLENNWKQTMISNLMPERFKSSRARIQKPTSPPSTLFQTVQSGMELNHPSIPVYINQHSHGNQLNRLLTSTGLSVFPEDPLEMCLPLPTESYCR